MENIRRVEIIVPSPEVERILELFQNKKVEGYTLIEKVRGMGHRGIQDGMGLTDAFTNSLIIWYCMPAKFESLKEEMRELLLEAGGVCAISDAQWLLH